MRRSLLNMSRWNSAYSASASPSIAVAVTHPHCRTPQKNRFVSVVSVVIVFPRIVVACGITSRSSRRRFASRMNLGVRRHGQNNVFTPLLHARCVVRELVIPMCPLAAHKLGRAHPPKAVHPVRCFGAFLRVLHFVVLVLPPNCSSKPTPTARLNSGVMCHCISSFTIFSNFLPISPSVPFSSRASSNH